MHQSTRGLFTGTLAAAVLLFATAPAHAESDFRLWFETGFRYRPVKELRLSLVQHLRFDEDVSRLSSVMPEIGLSYRPSRYFRTGVGYRLIYERDSAGELRVRHRLHIDGRLRFSPGDFVLGLRLRFQEQIRGVLDLDGDRFRHVLRTKASFGWRPNRWVRPHLGAELFVRLANDRVVEARKIRFTVGWSISPGDHDVDLFYRLEVPIADRGDATVHILGLAYTFDLEHPKRRKKSKEEPPEPGAPAEAEEAEDPGESP